MPTNSQRKRTAKKEKETVATLNLKLFRAVLLCVEILLLGWIALVNNGIFGVHYELEAPYFIVMAVVFFVVLLGITFFAKERNMLIVCAVFLIAATIGAGCVPAYRTYDSITCKGPGETCDMIDTIYRNIYWQKVDRWTSQ